MSLVTAVAASSRAQRRMALRASRRRVWIVLLIWTVLWAAARAHRAGYSWHYFDLGAGLLTHPGRAGGGLHVYASHPELQIGPLALVAAIPLHLCGPVAGRVLAVVVLTALGPAVVQLLCRIRDQHIGPTSDVLLLSTGLLVLPIWCEVATHYAHLDDAIAMLFAVAAVHAVLSRRASAAGMLIAAAIDSKPWAAGFVVLLFLLPRTDRTRAASVAVVGVAVAWLPFVVADPTTLALGHFTITNMDNSALRALGVHAAHTPWWDRPAQFGLGVTVAAIACRRGRPEGVLLAVIAARMLLDPATYPYYTSGLICATAVVDLLHRHRRVPMWTAAAALWYAMDHIGVLVLPPSWLGAIRALYCTGVLAALCLPVTTTRGSSGR